jgi:hypothetical protein
MECREKNIRDLIVDFIDGNLDSPEDKRVAGHLADCPECRKLEQEYRQTIASLRAAFAADASEHIPNDFLVQYVDDSESLDEKSKSKIQLHLAVCSVCERKEEMLRRVGAEQTSGQSNIIRNWLPGFGQNLARAFGRRPIFGFSMAAVLILAFAIIYWSVIGTDRGPHIQFTSTQNINWLQESIRSDRQLPEIHEENGRIRVGVKFLAFFDEEKYTIQLQSSGGAILQDLSIGRDAYNDIGIGLVIETSSLPSGEYRLMLISCSLADEKQSLQTAYPFILLKD